MHTQILHSNWAGVYVRAPAQLSQSDAFNAIILFKCNENQSWLYKFGECTSFPCECVSASVRSWIYFELVMIVVQVDLYLLPLSISGLEMQMENAFSSNCAIWLAYFIIIDFTILRSSSKCGNHCIQINKIHSCFAIFFRQIFDFEHQIYRIHISTEFSLVEKKNENMI